MEMNDGAKKGKKIVDILSRRKSERKKSCAQRHDPKTRAPHWQTETTSGTGTNEQGFLGVQVRAWLA